MAKVKLLWKAVPGYPGLYASSRGQLYKDAPDGLSGTFLNPTATNQTGHLRIWHNGKTVYVHVLVCLAFNGKAPTDKPCALHKDDNPVNNLPSNLYWGSRADNAKDMVSNDHSLYGERRPDAKLTQQQVTEIRNRYIKGKRVGPNTSSALAREFGVCQVQIINICNGSKWPHSFAA